MASAALACVSAWARRRTVARFDAARTRTRVCPRVRSAERAVRARTAVRTAAATPAASRPAPAFGAASVATARAPCRVARVRPRPTAAPTLSRRSCVSSTGTESARAVCPTARSVRSATCAAAASARRILPTACCVVVRRASLTVVRARRPPTVADVAASPTARVAASAPMTPRAVTRAWGRSSGSSAASAARLAAMARRWSAILHRDSSFRPASSRADA